MQTMKTMFMHKHLADACTFKLRHTLTRLFHSYGEGQNLYAGGNPTSHGCLIDQNPYDWPYQRRYVVPMVG